MISKYSGGRHALRKTMGIIALVLLLAGGAGAATLTVCQSECAYSSIQDAVNNASSGDTILVQSGTYYENVNVNKQLTLLGIGMPVVDAKGSGSAITLSADGITLEGFTATGAGSGAGIMVNSSDNTLRFNSISNNNYGIFLESASNNNTLSCNNASLNRNGIYIYSSSNNTLRRNNASGNYNSISLESSDNNTLDGNNALNNNNGILLYLSSNNNIIRGNNASSNNNRGFFLSSASNNTLNNNKASNNNRCGIFLESASNNNRFTGNNISSNKICGIYLDSSSNNNIHNNFFKNTNNFYTYYSLNNFWNTTKTSGTNIIGGPYLGGNFWAYPNGTGFSQSCPDVDSDGICDSFYALDSNNIDYLPLMYNVKPPGSVENLKNATYGRTYINWTWTNPSDPDFSHVMLYLNGIFITNILAPQNYYNFIGLEPDTLYELGTHTVDSFGNVNETWVNATSRTLSSSALPPAAVCGPDKLKCENSGATVQFNGSLSYDPDGAVISYDWEFGDGANGTGAAPTHKYSTYRWNGTAYQPFTVNLTVTDNDGLTNRTSQKVVMWIAGDSNGDGKVNILDASLVGLRWGGSDPCADLNNDGNVNIIDASIIGLNWGKTA